LYIDYLVAVVSAATDVESVVVAVESTATAVESVVASVDVPLPPHAVKAAIAKIAITFFICFLFFVFLF
jgi:hypothetical protein